MKGRLIVLSLLAVVALAVTAIASADVFKGTKGSDSIIGSPGPDLVAARAGDDTVDGEAGNDRIFGGRGNDRLLVGSGADVENGGDGNDVMHALAADGQVDRVDCGPGNDMAYENASEHDAFVNCEKVVTRVVTPKQAAEDDK